MPAAADRAERSLGADPARPPRLAAAAAPCGSGLRPLPLPSGRPTAAQVERFDEPLPPGGRGRRPGAPRRRLAQLALRRLAHAVHAARGGGRVRGASAAAAASGCSPRSRATCSSDAAAAGGGLAVVGRAAAVGARALRPRRATCRRSRTVQRARQGARPRAVAARPSALRARRPRLPVSSPARLRDAGRRPDDPVLGATVAKLRALAARRRRGGRAGRRAPSTGALPANCRVHVFGAGSRAERGRALRLVPATASSRRARSRSSRTSSRSTRSSPRPLTRPRARAAAALVHALEGEPHARRSPSGVATAVVSVDRRSFPLDSDKVVAIGHGIDTARFRCVERRARRAPARRLARAHLAGEGLRDDRARGRAGRRRARGVRILVDGGGAGRARAARGARRADARSGAVLGGPRPARRRRTCS